jgi:glycosyltransferase involved in cell wall biosynthesis
MEAISHLPNRMPDGSSWPRVSIVTPSYNQAEYVEETIRSVLLQGYPNLEYIIIDGASSDGSVEIIRRYEDQLAYWISEPDQGQADAIQKGFTRVTGDIVAYLNSDDVYLPNAIAMAVSAFQLDPELCVVSGDMRFVDAAGHEVGQMQGMEGDFFEHFLTLTNPIPQPSAFLTRYALDTAGGIDPAFHMLMDYDLWCRIGLRGMKIQRIPEDLSRFRIHIGSKTRTNILRFAQERRQLVEKYLADPVLGPRLVQHQRRLQAMVRLHLAGAYWLCDNKSEAYSHYWDAVRIDSRILLSRRSLSLLSRIVLRRRSFRGRFAERVAPEQRQTPK